MIIKSEFIAGETITNAFGKAIKVANLLGCYIEFDFNGVTCWATPNGSIIKGVASYDEAIRSESSFKLTQSR